MAEKCLLEKTGFCTGCNVLSIAQAMFRWKQISPEEAVFKVGKEYCPPNLKPDIKKIVNTEANFSMGQRNEENTYFND